MPFGRRIKIEDFEGAALPHLKDLYRTAARLTADRTEGEDLVQEVYLQAWKSFHRFEIGTNCRAWLFKIMFNKFKHYRRKRFKLIGDSEKTLESLTYEPPVPEHLSDEDILMALGKIPEQYRETILLADVEEFSYKEAAFILKVPVGTVMSRLSRGRRLLRVALAETAESYGIKNVQKGADQG
ncbi:MAG: sigma-70 family RNA polymerase sigma factor [Pyrinomonadaceae bacterium]|jgi:RNA polymerase sigma-70 factor (ECF subfamily)|nr:sigma-70 family RNA polymerase sigma factor [Pyrinomonadaceae bacterium]